MSIYAVTAIGDWERFRRALDGVPLPAALVDLDAVDANLERLLAPVRARGKTLRLATKSVRCPALIRYLVERGGGTVRGLMTYSAGETAFLAAEGFDDLLLAYPTLQPSDAALLAEANRAGACARVAVDAAEQLAPLAAAARAAATRIPVVIDVDLAYRPLGGLMHLGVRRSPLRAVADVVEFAARVAAQPALRLDGLLGYEAQIAGLTDNGPFARWSNFGRRGMKRLSRTQVVRQRRALVDALAARGLAPTVFNGGGTGSLGWASEEDALTEVTAGSGFLDSLLFDHYRQLSLRPALFFGLQTVRRPTPRTVTCHGGGFVASGASGEDRLPRPALPPGCRLLPMEGAGEVQTPVVLPDGVDVKLGDPLFFRPAKSGELAEHFNEYFLVRGESISERAKTYRGLGHCFLG